MSYTSREQTTIGIMLPALIFPDLGKNAGQPVTPLISWQDNRGITRCETLQTVEPIIYELTGLRLSPCYFAPKLSVLLQTHPEWRGLLECGNCLRSNPPQSSICR